MKLVATQRGLGSGNGSIKSPKSLRRSRLAARSMPPSAEFATLGLTALASRSEVKNAYKRLALKYHPDVIKGENGRQDKDEVFKEIKSAYESLMTRLEQENSAVMEEHEDEWDEWEEWVGFEGGMPYHPDVIKGENGRQDKDEVFKEIKSAYESLMTRLEQENSAVMEEHEDEWDEWEEWMGFEGGMPVIYNPS